MALLLIIETGTRTCSVAIAEDENVLVYKEEANTKSHAKIVHSLIADSLSEIQKTTQDLDAIVVGAGPGSYTGLRIGMAAAKGLAFTLDIPLIALDTLKSVALAAIEQVKDENAMYLATLKSRKGEIYYTLLNGKGEIIEASKPAVVNDLDFSKHSLFKFYVIDNCDNRIKNYKFDDSVNYLKININAKVYVNEAFKAFNTGRFEDINKMNPLYLKPFM